MFESCLIDDCGRPANHWAEDVHVCRMHWKRWARNGSFVKRRITAAPRAARGICVIESCVELDEGAHGLCKLHASRQRRTGDPLKVILPSERNLPTGAAHPAWIGDDATYFAVHQRLVRTRGRAAGHTCTDCEGPAAQWSLNRDAPDLRLSDIGPFTTDLSAYLPRCVPCHKRYDLSAIGASK